MPRNHPRFQRVLVQGGKQYLTLLMTHVTPVGQRQVNPDLHSTSVPQTYPQARLVELSLT